MRIIGGQAKGTRLSEFKGRQIRPTLDRVKESLFNQIQPYINGSLFLDLFAGTGNIGLEAWSRGAAMIIFVEQSPKVFETLSDNLKKCDVDERIKFIQSDAFQALAKLESQNIKFDIVYIDPPFKLNLYDSCLETISKSISLKRTTIAIVEHHHKTKLKKKYGKIVLRRQRKLGDTQLSFFSSQPIFI